MDYQSNNIDIFNDALAKYLTNKTDFDEKMNYYKKIFTILQTNYDNSFNPTLITVDGDYDSSYILLNNCILKKTGNGQFDCNTVESYDDISANGIIYELSGNNSSDNPTDSGNNRETIFLEGDINSSIDCDGIDKINKLSRLGLNEYDLSENINYENLVVVENTSTVDFSSNSVCNEVFVNKCHNYSQFMNEDNKKYGIYQDGNDNCNCILDPGTSDANIFTSSDVTFNVDGGSNAQSSGSYLMIMMDAQPYILTESNFSDNFNNYYVKNDSYVKQIDMSNNDNTGSLLSDNYVNDQSCNLFAGSGVTNIDSIQIDDFLTNCRIDALAED